MLYLVIATPLPRYSSKALGLKGALNSDHCDASYGAMARF